MNYKQLIEDAVQEKSSVILELSDRIDLAVPLFLTGTAEEDHRAFARILLQVLFQPQGGGEAARPRDSGAQRPDFRPCGGGVSGV